MIQVRRFPGRLLKVQIGFFAAYNEMQEGRDKLKKEKRKKTIQYKMPEFTGFGIEVSHP